MIEISLNDYFCHLCIANLLTENEIVTDFYIYVSLLYLKGNMLVIERNGKYHKKKPLIKRLEKLGYFTSTEIAGYVAVCRPTGIEVANGEATICAKRKEHDHINYAL